MSSTAAAARPDVSDPTSVLLVDDTPAVLRVTRAMLEAEGLSVVEAGDAGAALALCSDESLAFDLLVTDGTLPDMTGVELARRALHARPGLKVVFVSGNLGGFELPPGAVALGKPYSRPELADAVARALAE